MVTRLSTSVATYPIGELGGLDVRIPAGYHIAHMIPNGLMADDAIEFGVYEPRTLNLMWNSDTGWRQWRMYPHA
jgi:hypothetical protein